MFAAGYWSTMGGLLNILFDFQVKTSKQLAKILAFSLTVSAGLYLEILLCVAINHSRWNCRWLWVTATAAASTTVLYVQQQHQAMS